MIATVCVVWLGSVVPQVQALDYGQPSAALWKDQLFVAITGRAFNSPAVLYRGKFTPESRRVRDPLEHHNPSGDLRDSTQAKLDLREDRLLLHSAFLGYCIYPLDQVWRLEDSAFGFGRLRWSRDLQRLHLGVLRHLRNAPPTLAPGSRRSRVRRR